MNRTLIAVSDDFSSMIFLLKFGNEYRFTEEGLVILRPNGHKIPVGPVLQNDGLPTNDGRHFSMKGDQLAAVEVLEYESDEELEWYLTDATPIGFVKRVDIWDVYRAKPELFTDRVSIASGPVE